MFKLGSLLKKSKSKAERGLDSQDLEDDAFDPKRWQDAFRADNAPTASERKFLMEQVMFSHFGRADSTLGDFLEQYVLKPQRQRVERAQQDEWASDLQWRLESIQTDHGDWLRLLKAQLDEDPRRRKKRLTKLIERKFPNMNGQDQRRLIRSIDRHVEPDMSRNSCEIVLKQQQPGQDPSVRKWLVRGPRATSGPGIGPALEYAASDETDRAARYNSDGVSEFDSEDDYLSDEDEYEGVSDEVHSEDGRSHGRPGGNHSRHGQGRRLGPDYGASRGTRRDQRSVEGRKASWKRGDDRRPAPGRAGPHRTGHDERHERSQGTPRDDKIEASYNGQQRFDPAVSHRSNEEVRSERSQGTPRDDKASYNGRQSRDHAGSRRSNEEARYGQRHVFEHLGFDEAGESSTSHDIQRPIGQPPAYTTLQPQNPARWPVQKPARQPAEQPPERPPKIPLPPPEPLAELEGSSAWHLQKRYELDGSAASAAYPNVAELEGSMPEASYQQPESVPRIFVRQFEVIEPETPTERKRGKSRAVQEW